MEFIDVPTWRERNSYSVGRPVISAKSGAHNISHIFPEHGIGKSICVTINRNGRGSRSRSSFLSVKGLRLSIDGDHVLKLSDDSEHSEVSRVEMVEHGILSANPLHSVAPAGFEPASALSYGMVGNGVISWHYMKMGLSIKYQLSLVQMMQAWFLNQNPIEVVNPFTGEERLQWRPISRKQLQHYQDMDVRLVNLKLVAMLRAFKPFCDRQRLFTFVFGSETNSNCAEDMPCESGKQENSERPGSVEDSQEEESSGAGGSFRMAPDMQDWEHEALVRSWITSHEKFRADLSILMKYLSCLLPSLAENGDPAISQASSVASKNAVIAEDISDVSETVSSGDSHRFNQRSTESENIEKLANTAFSYLERPWWECDQFLCKMPIGVDEMGNPEFRSILVHRIASSLERLKHYADFGSRYFMEGVMEFGSGLHRPLFEYFYDALPLLHEKLRTDEVLLNPKKVASATEDIDLEYGFWSSDELKSPLARRREDAFREGVCHDRHAHRPNVGSFENTSPKSGGSDFKFTSSTGLESKASESNRTGTQPSLRLVRILGAIITAMIEGNLWETFRDVVDPVAKFVEGFPHISNRKRRVLLRRIRFLQKRIRQSDEEIQQENRVSRSLVESAALLCEAKSGSSLVGPRRKEHPERSYDRLPVGYDAFDCPSFGGCFLLNPRSGKAVFPAPAGKSEIEKVQVIGRHWRRSSDDARWVTHIVQFAAVEPIRSRKELLEALRLCKRLRIEQDSQMGDLLDDY